MGIYEAYQIVRYGKLIAWPQWADLLSKWNHFILAVNSSINIIIYVIKDFKFRASLSALLSGRKLPIIRRSRVERGSSWLGSYRSNRSEMTLKTFATPDAGDNDHTQECES